VKPPDGGEVGPKRFAPAFLQSFNERVERILGELFGLIGIHRRIS
jgi:hypothetical protein